MIPPKCDACQAHDRAVEAAEIRSLQIRNEAKRLVGSFLMSHGALNLEAVVREAERTQDIDRYQAARMALAEIEDRRRTIEFEAERKRGSWPSLLP